MLQSFPVPFVSLHSESIEPIEVEEEDDHDRTDPEKTHDASKWRYYFWQRMMKFQLKIVIEEITIKIAFGRSAKAPL
jgi:hypothetical protein